MYLEPDLSVNLTGIKLANPTILASGILGVSSDLMIRVARAGAAAVVTKSFNRNGREGYRNPSFIQLQGGFLNALGIPNPGMIEMRGEIEKVAVTGVPIIASVFGFDAEEFAEAAVTGEKAGASAIELNVSCPHVKEVGVEIGQKAEMVHEVVRAVKKTVRLPVFAKLTPNVTSIANIAKAARDGGADGITAVNTVLGMAIDVDAGQPALAGIMGGLSGPVLHAVAVRAVYEIRRAVDLPIIGVGGIEDWRSAVEIMMAGASAVQIGSAIAYNGLDVFRNTVTGINKFLGRSHYRSIRDIVGLAAHVVPVPEISDLEKNKRTLQH
jgi:dihydroorotate dehydrogenase (NAD+) catalytic subunit